MPHSQGRTSVGLAISGIGLLIVILTALALSPTDAALLVGLSLIAFGGIAAIVAELRGIRSNLESRTRDRDDSPHLLGR